MFQLTIVKGAYYRRLAEGNRMREVIIEPERGTIIDRKGLIIAENSEANIDSSGERLFSRRQYHDGEAVASIVGYRQVADENDLKNDTCLTKLKLGDMVGKKGIEKKYDCVLRGKHGTKLVEINAQGKLLDTLSVIPPTSGKTLQLALDLELQKKAIEALAGKKGAVVATQPKTGEVLVMVSTPSYNPQFFEDGDDKAMNAYLKNEDKPLFNRALEGVYPPGSTFKIVMASAALQEKAIEPDTIFEDTGVIKAGAATFGNWYYLEYGKTEGPVDIVKALRRSNDIFFYLTGGKLGPQKIKNWAEKFGLGKPTGIGLEEASGSVPSPYWKEDVLKEQWYLGDTYNFSIGQGYLLTTPMQINQMASVIATNGKLCSPQLLKIQDGQPISCQSLDMKKEVLDLVKKGMQEACSPGGTGYPFFNFQVNRSGKMEKITVACKTGTAESHGDEAKPHAWFTVYAPAVNPEIVITVLVEESGQGSDIAGPIAKEVAKAYFERSQ